MDICLEIGTITADIPLRLIVESYILQDIIPSPFHTCQSPIYISSFLGLLCPAISHT